MQDIVSEKEFNYEGINIKYSLYSEKRKTLSISVLPNTSVIVKSPIMIKKKELEDFLKKKIIWIEKQKDYFKKFTKTQTKEFISGESFLYLGRRYKLLIKDTQKEEKVKLAHGLLTVFIKNRKSKNNTKRLLEQWFEARRVIIFNTCLREALKSFTDKVYKKDFNISTRKMNKRWGSFLFKKNRIILNKNLIKAPKKAIIYVITHELCHFKYRNHNKQFFNLLESKLANWKTIKHKLEIDIEYMI